MASSDPAVVRITLTPDTRQLLLRLIHAIEKLPATVELPVTIESDTSMFAESPPVVTVDDLTTRLAPAVEHLEELLADGGHDGAARRIIERALGFPIP